MLDSSHDEIESFLKEVRIPLSIIDLVLTTSSQEIRELNSYDNPELRKDRLYAEYEFAECGAGLSRQDRTLELKLMVDELEGKQLSSEQARTLRILSEAHNSHSTCTKAAQRRALREAQLGK